MRDLIDKLNEKAKKFPSEQEVENKIVDMVDFLGINGMFGDEDDTAVGDDWITDEYGVIIQRLD